MSGTLARARIKPIAHIVPSSRIVGLTVERTFLKRILLRDAVPVLKDEIIPLQRQILADLSFGRSKQDGITARAASQTRHPSPPHPMSILLVRLSSPT